MEAAIAMAGVFSVIRIEGLQPVEGFLDNN
jgi:hypothetical protein